MVSSILICLREFAGIVGLLLGFYLAGLAIGAQLGGLSTVGVPCGTRRWVEWLSALLLIATLAGYIVAPGAAALASLGSPRAAFFLVAIASALFGALLPIIAELSIRPDELAGARLSYVYLANIIGSAVGALTTGYWFLDVWTTRQLALGLVFVGLALALFVPWLVPASRTARLRGVFVAIGAAALVASIHPRAFDRLYERLLFKDSRVADRFVDLVENRQGVVAVTPSLQVYGGGAYDGVISTSLVHDRNLLVRVFGAVALHPHPRQVLMIGLSTGAWAQVIANSEDVEHLTVVEINPGYLSIIARHPEVRGLLSNPKVTIVIDDGRRWLVHHPTRFDLIVQNTTEHWRANVTNLLSREYLGLIRRHLRPGGIYHYNTTDSQDAYKTAFTVFPYGLRFVNFASVSDSPIGLDSTRWRGVLTRYRIDGRPVLDLAKTEDRIRLDSLMAFAASADHPPRFYGLESRDHMLGRLTQASVVTDDNMLPEWRTLLLGQ